MGNRPGAGSPCPGDLRRQALFRRADHVRRRSQHPGVAGRRRHARHAARHQRALRRAGRAHRARVEREDQSALGVRPQELLLCRPAGRLSDLPVQGPDRGRGRGRDRFARRQDAQGRHRAPASRAGRRQAPARSAPEPELCRPEPVGRGADGDREQARYAHGRRGRRLSHQAALDRALSRYLRRQYGRRLHALRRQRLGAQARRRAGHALRDQEREFDPLRQAGDRVRGAAPGRADRGRRQDRAGDAPVRFRPWRDALDALQGGRARLSLLPRSRPAAAGPHTGLCREDQGEPARAAGRKEEPLHRRLRPLALRRGRPGGGEGHRRILRGRRQGPRRQAGDQLGHRRFLRHAESPRRRHCRIRR